MRLITLENKYIKLVLNQDLGMSVYEYSFKRDGKWINIGRTTKPENINSPGDHSSFVMVPYSNRVENACLHWDGKTYELEPENAGHSIHGVCRHKPFEIIDQTDTMVKASFNSQDFDSLNWPFDFYCEYTHTLVDKDVFIKIELKNTNEEDMPAGFGIHPYFNRNLDVKDELVQLKMPIEGVYPGDTQIPTGHFVDIDDNTNPTPTKYLSASLYDKCLKANGNTSSIIWEKAQVKLDITATDNFTHLIHYRNEHPEFFAVEPVTNCNNAFNMYADGIKDTNTVVLSPNEIMSGEIQLKLEY